jgi:hypothetical protein
MRPARSKGTATADAEFLIESRKICNKVTPDAEFARIQMDPVHVLMYTYLYMY